MRHTRKATAQTAHLFFCRHAKPTLKKPKELFIANARTEYTKFENDKKELKINGQTESKGKSD